MSKYYAWEASHGFEDRVHAVIVFEDDERFMMRNDQSLCGRKIGQKARIVQCKLTHERFVKSEIRVKAERKRRYMREGLNEQEADKLVETIHGHITGRSHHQVRAHLQLHLASDVAHLTRCRHCEKVLETMKRGKSELYYRDDRYVAEIGPLEQPEEWKLPMPFYEGEWVPYGIPTEAQWPTYYRYRVPLEEQRQRMQQLDTMHIDCGFWQPVVRVPQPQLAPYYGYATPTMTPYFGWANQATLSTAATNTLTSVVYSAITCAPDWGAQFNAMTQQGQAPGYDAPLPEGMYPRARQYEIAEARADAMDAYVKELDAARVDLDEQGKIPVIIEADLNALELLKGVVGQENYDHFLEHQYIDVESKLFGGRGYRIRPWKRVGVLNKEPDGSWKELNKSYCIHPDELYPMADEMATLFLAIKFDESQTIVHAANLHDRPAWVAA